MVNLKCAPDLRMDNPIKTGNKTEKQAPIPESTELNKPQVPNAPQLHLKTLKKQFPYSHLRQYSRNVNDCPDTTTVCIQFNGLKEYLDAEKEDRSSPSCWIVTFCN